MSRKRGFGRDRRVARRWRAEYARNARLLLPAGLRRRARRGKSVRAIIEETSK